MLIIYNNKFIYIHKKTRPISNLIETIFRLFTRVTLLIRDLGDRIITLKGLEVSMNYTGCYLDNPLYLEHVIIIVTIQNARRGDLEITLVNDNVMINCR